MYIQYLTTVYCLQNKGRVSKYFVHKLLGSPLSALHPLVCFCDPFEMEKVHLFEFMSLYGIKYIHCYFMTPKTLTQFRSQRDRSDRK